jgi:hypothetical protein
METDELFNFEFGNENDEDMTIVYLDDVDNLWADKIEIDDLSFNVN